MVVDENILDDVTISKTETSPVDKEWGSWGIHPRVLEELQGKNKKISWRPKSLVYHTKAFVEWINSITYGIFPNMLTYMPYERYKAEALLWLEERINPLDIKDEYQQELAIQTELERIDKNTLFFACKYGIVKEGSVDEGFIKYRAKEHNAFLFYLLDCGYCLLIGKPRQIFATTTLGMFAVKRMITRANYFMKFITSTDDKGIEIMRDKFKFVFGWLPAWMKASVASDTQSVIHLGKKTDKGEIGFPNSRIEQVAPSSTAINGGSPQMSLLDEIGELPDLINTLDEIRPTLYMDLEHDGNLTLKRTLLAWGCVCAGTKVWTNSGELVNIEDLKMEQGILGYDGKEASKEDITYWQEAKEKECVRITTNTGRTLECSVDHPVLWSKPMTSRTKLNHKTGEIEYLKRKEFRRADQINKGDQVACIEEVPYWGENRIWEARFIGWMIGDGTYGKGIGRMPRLSGCSDEMNDYVLNNFDSYVTVQYETKDGRQYKEITIKGVNQKFRELGIHGQAKLEKRLPEIAFSSCKEDVCEMIGGFFDADGCVHYTKDSHYIDLTSSCFELLDQVRILLQKLGIHSAIRRIKCKIEEGSKDRNDWYVLYISDIKSIRKFAEQISFKVGYKQERLQIILNKTQFKTSKVDNWKFGLRFERVVSVESIGVKPVYNLTANTTHTYIANGIVTHNTGVSNTAGKKGFERLWNATIKLWEEENYRAALFVPVFMSWHCRATKDFYDSEHSAYMAGTASGANLANMSEKEREELFKMHYPTTFRDMFGGSSGLLIDGETIIKQRERIRNIPADCKPVAGWFEPIYDMTKPEPETSDVPFKIIGSRFVPADDYDSPEKISAVMVLKPDYNYKNRYFQGTDPIANETGISFMASAIWDRHINYKDKVTEGAVCLIYHRKAHDPKSTFLQCLLMGLYYDTNNPEGAKQGVPELIENNIGGNYKEYLEQKGFYRRIVYNTELPEPDMMGGGANWGINTSGRGQNRRKLRVVGKMRELAMMFGNTINLDVFWKEMETYTNVMKAEEAWAPVDKRMYRDDALDGVTFSYICSLCYQNVSTIKKDIDETTIYRTIYEQVRMPDGELVVEPKRVRA